MLSNELSVLVSPFKKIVSKQAISPLYRSIELSPAKIAACSHYGILELKTDIGLKETAYVDAVPFLAIVDSLPDKEEFKLELKEKVFVWKCGSASGRLATLDISDMPKIQHKVSRQAWTPTTDFAQALSLGALSCADDSLQSVGLYGVVVDTRNDNLEVCSSDNVSLSVCVTKTGKPAKTPELLNFSPVSLSVLSSIMCCSGALIEVDNNSLFYADNQYSLVIKQIPKLSRDYREIYSNFQGGEVIAKIPQDRINHFIKRASALAENAKRLHVILQVEKGKMSFQFEEGTASSEEHYLIDGLDVPDLSEIKLDATRVSRALKHVDRVVLDYIDRGVIVFRGSDPDFYYIVSGKRD